METQEKTTETEAHSPPPTVHASKVSGGRVPVKIWIPTNMVEDLSSFLGSSDVRTALNEATKKRVEEAYLCWEKVYLNGDGEQVALEITKTRQRCLTILHDFMVAIFSGT